MASSPMDTFIKTTGKEQYICSCLEAVSCHKVITLYDFSEFCYLNICYLCNPTYDLLIRGETKKADFFFHFSNCSAFSFPREPLYIQNVKPLPHLQGVTRRNRSTFSEKGFRMICIFCFCTELFESYK